MMNFSISVGGAFAIDSAAHQNWLAMESDRLVRFLEPTPSNAEGGYAWLDSYGRAETQRPLQLYAVARLVHCFSVEHILGRTGAASMAVHGTELLNELFSDKSHGGFFASVTADGAVTSSRKECYGHAFVVLGAASAMTAQLPGAEQLFASAVAAIDDHFWEPEFAAAAESYDREWDTAENYRGQNSNMHLTEAFLSAYEATGNRDFLARAERISERLIRDAALVNGGRVPEHFTSVWEINREFNRDNPTDPFRPFGTLVGHSFEWSRLLLTLRDVNPTAQWTLSAAVELFDQAVIDGWDHSNGGLVYSVDDAGKAVNRSRMHWVVAEAIGASESLYRATGGKRFLSWYREFWNFAEAFFIDRECGSWHHELDENNQPSSTTWEGKPDLYHAWQSTFYARISGNLGVARAAATGNIAQTQIVKTALDIDVDVEKPDGR